MKNYLSLLPLFLQLTFGLFPLCLQAAPLPTGNPPSIQQGGQDSIQALLGHCQPFIEKKYNCSEGTVELSAFVSWLFTGQTDPITAVWSNGVTAHKIVVTPPGTWSWDATITGCEPYHFNTTFTSDSVSIYPPATPQLLSPASGASGMHSSTKLVWNDVSNTAEFLVQIATNPSFAPGTIFATLTVTDSCTTITPAPANNTVYYWRVKAMNGCAESAFSSVFSFQTGQPQCNQVFNSTDVPAAFLLNPVGTNVALSTLNVPLFRDILDVNVAVAFNHPWTGDLSASLVSPHQDTILLFDRPGVPATAEGCSRDNGNLNFDHQSTQAATLLESQCNNNPPALSGTFRPIGDLLPLNGKNAQGQWQMILTDHNAGLDTGAIQSWKLTLCLAAAIPPATMLANLPLYVVTAESDTISQQHLKINLTSIPSTGFYILLALPQHGALLLNGVPLSVGAKFTQQDIDQGKLVYAHNGDAATEDEFRFDALDNISHAWLHDQVFHIVILPEQFEASIALTQAIVCPGGATGEITVTAIGLGGNYTYSLNGGPAQSSNVFGNLTDGTYVVTVTSQVGISITTLPFMIFPLPAITIDAVVVCDYFTVEVIGATPALQYSLDGGPFQAENQFFNLPNRSYVLLVQDSNGCQAVDTVTVAYIPFSLTAETQEPKCSGSQNGSITLAPQGGQMPFSYQLNGAQGQSSNVFNGLSAGVYSLLATDHQGCTATMSVPLAEPDPIQLTTTISWNNISIQASGGTGILTYSINGVQFQLDSQFLNVPNGNYLLRVRDENGCLATAPVTINVLTGAIQAPSALCAGNVFTLTVNASGGLPPYAYQLNGGMFGPDNTFGNLGPGTYSVVIRDAANTEITLGAFQCIEFPNPELSVTVHCKDATLSISGGTPPYTSNPSASQLTLLPNGNYAVVVTDSKGCTVSSTFEIDAPVITTTVETVDALCYGDSTGSATIEAMGGIAPYMYSFFGGPFQTSNIFDDLPGGWFYYHVKDSAGCVDEFWLEILQPDSSALEANVVGSSIFANAIGGTGAYTYRLNNGPGQSSGLFENLPLGTYTVSAKDEVQCELMAENLAIVTIGTTEETAPWKTTIYPNPGSGLFRLMLQQAPMNLRIEVYTNSGQLIQHQELTSLNGRLETAIHLEHFPEGTYLLVLSDDKFKEHVFLSKVNR